MSLVLNNWALNVNEYPEENATYEASHLETYHLQGYSFIFESKCRKDEEHDLQYGPWPPAEFRWASMRHLSHWSGQQQHLLQWLQALGAQEMQWAQVLDKGPWLQMYILPGNCRPLGRQTTEEVQVGPNKLEAVASFCYLGDILSAARMKTAWKKFKELLPVLSSCHLSFKTLGHVYSSCVQSAMIHASGTWPLTKPDLQCLLQNDGAIIRQICNVRLQDIVTTRSNELLAWLRTEDLDLILKVQTCGMHQWCSQDSLSHTGWGKAWAWEAQDDMEAADREGLQRVEALRYQPSW